MACEQDNLESAVLAFNPDLKKKVEEHKALMEERRKKEEQEMINNGGSGLVKEKAHDIPA
jgi:ribosomal protein S9